MHTQQYATICVKLHCSKLCMLFHDLINQSSKLGSYKLYTFIYLYFWWDSHQSIGIDMGGSINGVPKNGWFISWKIPSTKMDDDSGYPHDLGNLQMMYPGWKKSLPTGFGIEKAPLLPRTAAVPWARAPAAWPWPRKWDWDEPSFLGG